MASGRSMARSWMRASYMAIDSFSIRVSIRVSVRVV
jgi:hypothetical protein